MKLVPCMGGFCGQRNGCAHYHAEPTPGLEPAERLCARGKPEPVSLALMRPAPVDPYAMETA